MENKHMYSHIVTALTVRLSGRETEVDPPGEGSLELIVENGNKSRFNCFMGHKDAGMFYTKEVKQGDRITIEFWLSGDSTDVKRLKKKVKKTEWIDYPEFMSNYYFVSGDVIQILPHPEWKDSDLAVLDCGVYIYTRVVKSANLKIGDYIQMQGRLDAYIIGKAQRHE